ncbi:amphi-Trp domain-containing protein [Desulfohalovibrio reitneri]|uniref:amphi-Trp domain-containing protein n=1 Tax=Desulfohalovibrio reitneri TaxID=1307759 RepID=UPI0004A77904|nr:amphi-Trp domain-containing protein [Desulfohalovibrio reitneri]
MPEKVLFKSEEPSSRGDAAKFLRQLADKVESGHVVLKQAGEETSLDLPENLTLEVKAEQEMKPGRAGKMSLEVEMEWTPGEEPKGGVELA